MSVIASNSTPSPVAPGGPVLQHWPREAAQRLEALIAAHAHQGAFAVFDADNTTYHHYLVVPCCPSWKHVAC